MNASKKKRLDQIIFDNGHTDSIRDAEILIRSGKVYANETIADKPGHLFGPDTNIRVKTQSPYVSRGGIKLAGALNHFSIDPSTWICADIGASSGGFTDCLLQHGARHVFAVDVGYGQLDWKLRTDDRVTVLERLNVKNIRPEHITRPLDLAVFDTSFISLKQVIPPMLPFFPSTCRIIALIKPQFELLRDQVGVGGIVHEETLRQQAVAMIKEFGDSRGLQTIGVIPSSIKGPKGNQEYLIYLIRT